MEVYIEHNRNDKETNYILDFGENFRLEMTTTEYNEFVLDEFHKAVEWLLKKGFDEYIEIESNTINPVQQNIFIPLRVYRVLKNGHYRIFKIFARCFGGILVTER